MKGAKVAAWSCIAVGGALSLAANLAYAYLDGKQPSRQDVFIAVIWPVLLYGALELFIRVPWPNTFLGWLFRLLASGLVGAVALVTSYGHMHDVLKGANDHPFARVFGPIAIDGLMVSAAAALVVIKQAEALLAVAKAALEESRTTSPALPAATSGGSTPPSDASPSGTPPEAAQASAPAPRPAGTSGRSGGGRKPGPKLPALTDAEALEIGVRVLRDAQPDTQAEYMKAFRAVRGGDTAVIKRSYAPAREAAAKPQLVAIGG